MKLKKYMSVFLAFIMLFSLAGCGKKAVEEPQKMEEQPVEAEVPELIVPDEELVEEPQEEEPIEEPVELDQKVEKQQFVSVRYNKDEDKLLVVARGYDTTTWMLRLNNGSSVKLADYEAKNFEVYGLNDEAPTMWSASTCIVLDHGATVTVYGFKNFPSNVTLYLAEAVGGEGNGVQKTGSGKYTDVQMMLVTDTTTNIYTEPITAEDPQVVELGGLPNEGSSGEQPSGGNQQPAPGEPQGGNSGGEESYTPSEEVLAMLAQWEKEAQEATERQAACPHVNTHIGGSGGVVCNDCGAYLGHMSLEEYYAEHPVEP